MPILLQSIAGEAPCSEDDPNTVPDVPGSCDLGRKSNLFQASIALMGSVVGAVVGFGLTNDRPGLAALVGGTVGFVLAVFVAGFVLMCLPRRRISLEAARIKLQSMKRRVNATRAVAVLMILICAGLIYALARQDNAWAFVVCVAAACLIPGTCLYVKGFVLQVREFEKAIQEAEVRQTDRHLDDQ